ncbi:MAG TPA: hypothetical protein VGN43_19920 [Steroidobacteraceae bacterium]|nr:hypothetical protein [Steroidobacteraceae bacterium]
MTTSRLRMFVLVTSALMVGPVAPVRTCYNEQHAKIKIHEYQVQRGQLRQGRFLAAGLSAGCNSRTCQ